MSANLMSLARSGGKFLKLFGDRKMMKQLPYDAEVEYLESTGTQYVDTGVIIPPDVDFEFTGSIVSDIANGCVFGETREFLWGQSNNGYALVTTAGGRIYLRYGNSTLTVVGLTDIGLANTFTASLEGNAFKVNGLLVSTVDRISSFDRPVSSMFVFRRNSISAHNPTFSAIRINNLKFGTLFDFIPVRKGTFGYMYDRISGQLFGNAGTGAFVIGPDKTI